MRNATAQYINRAVRGVAFAAVALVGIAMSCTPSFAQATYTYTGPNFTSIISGLAGKTYAYTTADHVTATLRLNEWLPSNASCIDVTKISGFSLVMSDGVNPPQEMLTPDQGGVQAVVSTDASGNITQWNIHVYLYPFQGDPDLQYIIYSDSGAVCGAAGYSDFAQVEPLTIIGYNFSGGSIDENIPNTGTWTTPRPTALATMLISEFQLGALPDRGHKLVEELQDVVEDLTHRKNDACRELAEIAYKVNALTTGNTFSPQESAFILQTVEIIESESNCVAHQSFDTDKSRRHSTGHDVD